MAARPSPSLSSVYPVFERVGTRWADNDIYGHVNNAVYYTLIDTAVNRFMISRAGLDIHSGPVIGLVVESGCRFHAPLSFPGEVIVGLKVARLGTSSVTWHAGIFADPMADGDAAAADAHFTHVLVDRTDRRPTPWPDTMRDALASALGRSQSEKDPGPDG